MGQTRVHDGVSDMVVCSWAWEAGTTRIGTAQWEGLSAALLSPQRLLRRTYYS
jgi:hypothetical protein